MASRRFTRLTNGFSKKLENHAAAVSLYVAHYNLCRWHETEATSDCDPWHSLGGHSRIMTKNECLPPVTQSHLGLTTSLLAAKLSRARTQE
jgi:hypothetical protein